VAKEIWALDLGAWSLKVARATGDKKSGTLVVNLYEEIRYDALELPEEASSTEKIRAGLEAFGRKHELPKQADLCVSVSGSEVFSRFINLPPVPESIGEIIHYEARQQIPFDIREVVWDYQPLKEEHQPGEEIEVGLFALKRETVDELMRMLEPWRRNLRIIQDTPLALYNFLCFEGHVEEPAIVLDMGASTTNLLVLNYPRFWLRPLLVGGDSITERLQRHFGISRQESERIKERAAESAREAQLLRVITPVIGNILSEIQRSLGYYKSLARGVKFNKIIALGNAFRLRGLAKAIGEGLQYPVEEITQLRRIQLAMPLRESEFLPRLPGACPALGLLVQGAGLARFRINLVPEELARAAMMARKKPLVAAAAVGVLAIAGVLYAGERVHGKELAAHADAGGQLYEKVRKLEQEFKSAQGAAAAEEKKVLEIAGREVERDVLLRLIPELAQALPAPVYLQRMEFRWMDRREFEKLARGAAEATVEGGIPGMLPPRPGMMPSGQTIRAPRPGIVGAGQQPPVSARKPGPHFHPGEGYRPAERAPLPRPQARVRRRLPGGEAARRVPTGQRWNGGGQAEGGGGRGTRAVRRLSPGRRGQPDRGLRPTRKATSG